MYKSIETGNGDYAVIFDCDFPMLIELGLDQNQAYSLAQSMQVDFNDIISDDICLKWR